MKCFQRSKGGKNSNLRVHVGAVEVDLSSGLVDRAADLGDRGLEHAVRGGVRDHDTRQGGRVLLDLRWKREASFTSQKSQKRRPRVQNACI